MLTLAVSSLVAKIPETGSVAGKVRHFTVWLGRNTIGIYLVHLPIIRFFIAPKLHELGLDRLSVHGALIDTVLTMVVCCAIIWVVQKYIPALFGRFGGAYAAFRDLLLETRADGVITSEESDRLMKAVATLWPRFDIILASARKKG